MPGAGRICIADSVASCTVLLLPAPAGTPCCPAAAAPVGDAPTTVSSSSKAACRSAAAVAPGFRARRRRAVKGSMGCAARDWQASNLGSSTPRSCCQPSAAKMWCMRSSRLHVQESRETQQQHHSSSSTSSSRHGAVGVWSNKQRHAYAGHVCWAVKVSGCRAVTLPGHTYWPLIPVTRHRPTLPCSSIQLPPLQRQHSHVSIDQGAAAHTTSLSIAPRSVPAQGQHKLLTTAKGTQSTCAQQRCVVSMGVVEGWEGTAITWMQPCVWVCGCVSGREY